MYFRALPRFRYPWTDKEGKEHGALVPDIFRRVQLDKIFKNRNLLNAIFVGEHDTPESIAHQYYGNVNYHWVILMANDIVDVNREWPLSNRNLVSYVKDKYGENNSADVHHYVSSTDSELIVDWDAVKVANGTILAVTNYDYEDELNDKKRQKFLLDKRYLKDIVSQYKKLVK